LDNRNDSEDDCAVDDEFVIEHNRGIEDPECQDQLDVSAVPNVPVLLQPTQQPKRQAEKPSLTVNAVEMRRNHGVKKK
jgi:hypothetical protein